MAHGVYALDVTDIFMYASLSAFNDNRNHLLTADS